VNHLLVVEFESDNPRVCSLVCGIIKDRNFVVKGNKLLVSLDDGLFGVRIVEDLRARNDMLQSCVLNDSSKLGDNLFTLSVLFLKADLK